MTPERHPFLTFARACWLPLMILPLPARGAETPAEAARAALRRGDEQYAQKNYPEAKAAYEIAWEHKQSYSIACKLGRTEATLGDNLPRAASLLTYCVDHFTDTGEELEVEVRFEDLRQEVLRQVLTVRLSLTPAESKLYVDNQPADRYGGKRLFLSPGSHTLAATLPGYHGASTEVQGEAGETVRATLELKPLASAPSAPILLGEPEVPAPPPPKRWPPGPTWVPIVGYSLAGAALALGAGFQWQASEKDEDADRLRKKIRQTPESGSCGDGSHPLCDRLGDAEVQRRQAARVAIGSYAAAGVLALTTTATWFFWPRRPSKEAAMVWVGGGATMGTATVHLGGRW